MNVELASKGSASAGAGASSALLGGMVQLSNTEWIVLCMIVALAVLSGALAKQGQIESREDVTREEIARERRRTVMFFAAQFLMGMVLAANLDGNIWLAIPGCILIGWSGSAVLKWLEKRTGFGD